MERFWIVRSQDSPARYVAGDEETLVTTPDRARHFMSEAEAETVASATGMRVAAGFVISFAKPRGE
jgi:hypothetical protein